MGAEYLFTVDNARPHRAEIVDECLQSEDITRMDWAAYSPVLNQIEHVLDILDRRMEVRPLPATCLPERRPLLDKWCNIPQDQIDKLILSMPRHCKCNTPLDNRRLKRFYVLNIHDEDNLIVPLKPGEMKIQYYATNVEFYSVGYMKLTSKQATKEEHNTTYHEGIGQSLCETMFKVKTKRGIASSFLPSELISNVETEEQLEETANTFETENYFMETEWWPYREPHSEEKY
ncbi:uncharacterized protein TNCV_3470741 [Trichonephila clavipes]|nr:uncharacterized protein TNCV_3470741 [Trichonephila clavipes]